VVVQPPIFGVPTHHPAKEGNSTCRPTIMSHLFVGTSGWNYKHWWNGVFYARDLKPANWLSYFGTQFETVEINNSFYGLPTEAAFQSWRAQTPKDFTFAVKASRYLTHIKRLREPAEPLDLFFSRARHLEEKLGPILFQLPPRFKCDCERLEVFLRALRAHPFGKTVRAVLEVRDRTWLVEPVFDLLRQFRTCLCFADWKDVRVEEPVTADFVYVRRHSGKAADGNYGHRALESDVERITVWLGQKLDVYIYFNNDWKGYALENARYVRDRLLVPVKT
jgi:uncharacterized protein YecE (DUF72 family)